MTPFRAIPPIGRRDHYVWRVLRPEDGLSVRVVQHSRNQIRDDRHFRWTHPLIQLDHQRVRRSIPLQTTQVFGLQDGQSLPHPGLPGKLARLEDG